MTTIFLDGASFFFDAAFSVTLLTPATLDDGLVIPQIQVSSLAIKNNTEIEALVGITQEAEPAQASFAMIIPDSSGHL